MSNFVFYPEGTASQSPDQKYIEPKMKEIPELSKQQGKRVFFAETPVTFEEYLLFAADQNKNIPDNCGWEYKDPETGEMKQYGRMPVININFFEMIAFINWLNEQKEGYDVRYVVKGDTVEVHGKQGYMLPTSEEWTVAAGNVDKQNLDEVAWYRDNSNGQTQPVGMKLPNNYGLYDMLGNVWEAVVEYEEVKTKGDE